MVEVLCIPPKYERILVECLREGINIEVQLEANKIRVAVDRLAFKRAQ